MAQRGAFGGQGTDGAALAVRPAAWADLAEILAVYAQARAFMRANGNASQWRDSHPPRALVEQDIAEGTGFVLVSGGGRVEGVFALLDGEDPAYARIEDGTWLSDAPYCAIHFSCFGAPRQTSAMSAPLALISAAMGASSLK